MTWLIGFAAVMVLVAVVISIVRGMGIRPTGKEEGGYLQADSLFTPAERAFLEILDKAVGTHYRVFGKVRVADILQVKPTKDNSLRQRAFNRINAKHFDFVLCRADDLTVVAVVELNDASHQQQKRRARDQFLSSACDEAGLPLVQVRAQRNYSIAEVRDTVAAALGLSKAGATPLQ